MWYVCMQLSVIVVCNCNWAVHLCCKYALFCSVFWNAASSVLVEPLGAGCMQVHLQLCSSDAYRWHRDVGKLPCSVGRQLDGDKMRTLLPGVDRGP